MKTTVSGILKPNKFIVWLIPLLFTTGMSSVIHEGRRIVTDPNRLNILMIVVDDLRPELGCYGAEYILTPNIDMLAGRSLVFERAYCQAPICNPSRMSFLSGLRPDQTGIHINDVPIRDYLPDVVTLPQYFRTSGYQTVGLGKVFHQGSSDPASWDHYWDGPPQRTYQLEKNIHINDVNSKVRRGRPYEDARVSDGAYTDGMITDSALAWMDRFRTETPFFLAVGLMKPHLPFNAPRKYWDLYEDPGGSYHRLEIPPEGAPPWALMNSGELRKYHSVPGSGPVPPPLEDTLVHGYYACISYMDAQVGRLLRKLEDLGQSGNTLVVLFGDHGYKLGDLGDWCKNSHYELDTHVPLMLYVPGSPSGRTASITELTDLFPTLVAASGSGPIPAGLPGTDLTSLFLRPDKPLKHSAVTIRPRKEVNGYSIRTEKYRLVKWTSGAVPDSTVFLELYDYSSDPLERKNLAMDPEYEAILDEHLALLKKRLGY